MKRLASPALRLDDSLPSLGTLADPRYYDGPLELKASDPAKCLAYLERMLLIRACEERLGDMKRDGLIGGPVHLGIGQEAIAVGVSDHLRASDRVFGTHRSHSHLLALGAKPESLFAEILTRPSGFSGGMGGSMHLWDGPSGFYGSVPIVAGTVPLAVGAGLAARMDGRGDVAVAYFGDGACEEGVVHESLNLAKVWQAPVIFVVENNLFSSHLHVSLRQPSDCMARFAAAHGVAAQVVDGNDVIAVARAAGRLIEQARASNGPGFLEAVTYRWRGHVDWREDVDVGVHRSAEELAKWKRRDPVARLSRALITAEHSSERDIEDLVSAVRQRVLAAFSAAERSPSMTADALASNVYAKRGRR